MTSTTVSRIGDEQLDLIFCYATSCEPSDLVDVALALQTGRSIPMVCRRWRGLGERHLYTHICIGSQGETKLHQLLARVAELTRHRSSALSRTHSLDIAYPHPPRANTADRDFCALLSHMVLRRLVTNFGSERPWLATLASKSNSSLTHLELRFAWTEDISAIIPHLNAFFNLRFLSIDDTATASEERGHAHGLAEPPELCLPRLHELRLQTTADEMIWEADDNGLIRLGTLAHLPVLRVLHLCAEQTRSGLDKIVEHLGRRLTRLVTDTGDIDIVSKLRELCPALLELTIRTGATSEVAQDEYDLVFAHPTLRRLVVSSFYLNFLLRRLESTNVPSLESVQYEGECWGVLLARSSSREPDGGDYEARDDIVTAGVLQEKGIPLFDGDGKLLVDVTPEAD